MPAGKAYEFGGVLDRGLICPPQEFVEKYCGREADSGTLSANVRRKLSILWIARALDKARRIKGRVPQLSTYRRWRLAIGFHRALDWWLAVERGAVSSTRTELLRSAGGHAIIRLAIAVSASGFEGPDRQRLADRLLQALPSKGRVDRHMINRHRLLLKLLRMKMMEAGWRGTLTLRQLGQALDAGEPLRPEYREMLTALSRLHLSVSSLTKTLHGSGAFQEFVRTSIPIWTQWTGRQAALVWDQAPEPTTTLYGFLRHAVSSLYRREPQAFSWQEQPETFQAIVRSEQNGPP